MPLTPFRITLTKGVAIAALGFLALIGAIANSLRMPEDKDARHLQSELDSLQKQLQSGQNSLRLMQDDVKQVEKDYAATKSGNETLGAEISARKERLSSLEAERTRMLAAAQQKLNGAVDANMQAEKQILKSSQEQLSQKQIQEMLARYQNMIVTFCSATGHLGTGFFYETGRGAAVVASLPPDSLKTKVIMKLRVYLPGSNQLTTIESLGDVLYTDPKTGLSFLQGKFPASFQVRRLNQDAAVAAAAGDKVYAIGTQVLGDELLENTVFDGDVSATDRQFEERTYLQVSIASNEGTRGAPLVNSQGALVGIMVGQAGGLERTSFAIPATDLAGAAARFNDALNSGRLQIREPAVNGRANEGADAERVPFNPHAARTAAEAHALPYQRDESIPLPAGINDDNFAVASNDNQVIIFNGNSIHAYNARKPAAVWQQSTKSEHAIFAVTDNHLWFVPLVPTIKTMQDIDLRTGAAQTRPLKLGSLKFTYKKLYGDENAYFATTGSSYSFIDTSTGDSFDFPGSEFLGIHGNNAFVKMQNGIMYFDIPTVRGLARQVLANLRKSRTSGGAVNAAAVAAANTANEDLQRQITNARKLTTIEEGTVRQLHATHVPGTDRVFANLHLVELHGDKFEAVATLPSPAHRSCDEPWFTAFLNGRIIQPAILAISPNRRWAISQTHLYDLDTLKAVAELPLPTPYAGFMSDNQTIFLQDTVHSCLYFLSVDQLLSGRASKAP